MYVLNLNATEKNQNFSLKENAVAMNKLKSKNFCVISIVLKCTYIATPRICCKTKFFCFFFLYSMELRQILTCTNENIAIRFKNQKEQVYTFILVLTYFLALLLQQRVQYFKNIFMFIVWTLVEMQKLNSYPICLINLYKPISKIFCGFHCNTIKYLFFPSIIFEEINIDNIPWVVLHL